MASQHYPNFFSRNNYVNFLKCVILRYFFTELGCNQSNMSEIHWVGSQLNAIADTTHLAKISDKQHCQNEDIQITNNLVK